MSNGAKHTPGPWKVFTSKSGFKLIGVGKSTGEGITDCGFGVWGGGDAEAIANARLIAAAPDYDTAAGLAITALAFAAETYQQAGDAVALAQTLQAKEALIAAQDKARGRNQAAMRDVTPPAAVTDATGAAQ